LLIAHDIDGREIVYVDGAGTFTVAGTPMDPDQLERYSTRGLVVWVTPELRAWFEQAHAARREAAVVQIEAELPASPAERPSAAEERPAPARAEAPQMTVTRDPAAERAHHIGSEGEQRVSLVLHALAAANGWTVFDDVLLAQSRYTIQIDHMLVDASGVVLVETKTMHALIRGREADKRWTACYPKRRNERFQNPLMQNLSHESFLLRSLSDAGIKLLRTMSNCSSCSLTRTWTASNCAGTRSPGSSRCTRSTDGRRFAVSAHQGVQA
jgi:hypothetical protein